MYHNVRQLDIFKAIQLKHNYYTYKAWPTEFRHTKV